MNKEELKIVFLGTPDFAVESLRRIHEGGYNIVGVVTMPDKPAGRGHALLHSPVKKYAVAAGLPLLQPVNLKDPAFLEELRSLQADLFVVIAFRMLPREVWQMPPLGTFNLHASLLPRYRGAAPINRAVMNGDSVTGVTTFFLKHEIDTGDIIAQESIRIGENECVGDIHDRLMLLGADLTIDTIDHIIAGDLKPIPQDRLIGDIEPTPAPKIFKEDCHIDWHRPWRQVHNQVRGLSPYPAAWTTLADDEHPEGLSTLKIYQVTPAADAPALAPGQLLVDGNRLIVGTADTPLAIVSLQPSGKKRMAAADWLRGARLGSGARFLN